MPRPKKNLTILPDPSGLQLLRLEADEQSIIAVVATTSSGALCPLCQCHSESIHSRYTRMVTDLPWAGWAVRLELHVRRFGQNISDTLLIFNWSSTLEKNLGGVFAHLI
jgi:transposase